jgi:hypothetical protein
VCSNRGATKPEAAKAARQSRGIRLAGWASVNAAHDMPSGTNKVVLGYRLKGIATEGGGKRSGVGGCGGRESNGVGR